jgi:hypothetical protein
MTAPESGTSTDGRAAPPRLIVLLCLLLALASFALYAPSLGFGYVAYDDITVLRGHPNLYNQDSFLQSLHEIFVGNFPREEPLLVRDVTWAIDARIFGFTSPFGFHFGNVVLHATNVVLLFLFLLHATRRLGFAAITAGLFATLAIHVEPVCWIMGRKDVLGGCFTLLALLLQSLGLRQAEPGRRRLLWLAVFLLYPLAVLSKLSAITLVLVLATHRILAPYLDGRSAPAAPIDWREARRTAFCFVPHVLLGSVLYLWYGHMLYVFQVIGGRGPSPLSLAHLRTLAVYVPLAIGRTVEHVLSAAEHSISYLRPNVALPLSRGDIAVVLAVVAVVASLLWFASRRRKDLVFFVLAFGFWLLPYFNVEYIGIWVADRYAYLASMCVVGLLVTFALEALASAGRARAVATVAAVGLGLLWACYGIASGRAHQRAFRDARALWSYEVGLPDPSLLAYNGLAKSFMEEAETTSGPILRRVHLAEMRSVAREGIRRYRVLPWLPARGYFIAARTEFAGLYGLLGRAAALAGAPPERRIQYLRRAYEIYPAASTALLLAKELFDQALPADEARARESLSFCADYAAKSWPDPGKHAAVRAIFGNYTRSFPALTAEVQAILGRLGN